MSRRVFYVLRHSERLDEVDEGAWAELIRRTYPPTASSSTTSSAGAASTTKKPSTVTTLPPIGNKSKGNATTVSTTAGSTARQTSATRRGSDSGASTKSSPLTTPRSSRTSQAAAPPSSSATTQQRGTSASTQGIASKPSPAIPKRAKQYFIQDPTLSPKNGIRYAEEVAHTMQQLISSSSISPSDQEVPRQVRLYSSKLRRAIQTAIPIARALNIPLFLSTGLSMAIAAIRKSGNGDGEGFQFISIEELRHDYPDVNFVDVDDVITATSSWINAIAMILQQSCDPTTGIMNDSIVNIIVGHRETIRGLAGEYLNTPYCAISLFESPEQMDVNSKLKKVSNGKRRDGEAVYPLITVLDRNGSVVDQTKKKG